MIAQSRYVDIASAVVGSTAVNMQSMDCRVFTGSDKVSNSQILEFANATEVLGFFGEGKEYKFASRYFAITTPAPVSKPKKIQFAYHTQTDRQYTVIGGELEEVETINLIDNGTFTYQIEDEEPVSIANLDFSNAESYGAILSIINNENNGDFQLVYTDGDITSYSNKEIVFSGEVADVLGLSQPSQILPALKSQTMLQAFASAYNLNNSFGSSYFLERKDLNQCVAVANYNASLNVRHTLFIQVKADRVTTQDEIGADVQDIVGAELTEFSEALIGTASTGLILEINGEEDEYVATIPAGTMSATDYTRKNGTVNYMFRDSGITTKGQVTNTQTANKLDKLRINYYGVTAEAGSDISFFQRGFLCGTANNPLDMSVHANEQWLKARFTQLWFSLMLSTRGVPANLDGKLRGISVIAEVVDEALNNGTILKGKNFTAVQKLAIADATGDENGWITVLNDGCWYDVEIKERSGESDIAEYYLDYILVYGKGDWVRKVTGSHNLV